MVDQLPIRPGCLFLGAALALLPAACADKRETDGPGDESPAANSGQNANDGGVDSAESGASADGEGSDDGAESNDDGDADEDGDDGAEGAKFDLGQLPDYIPATESGCAKVDFLFVIDNSGSMGDEQATLLRNFPRFIEAIEDTLMVSDIHVMAVDSDTSGGLTPFCPWGECNCFGDIDLCCGTACRDPANTMCNNTPCADWPDPGCVTVMGAGKTVNSVTDADCMLKDDLRYITRRQGDVDAVTEAFSCVARMGTNGDGDEKVMEAMVMAVDAPMVEIGGCNERFVRKDAILVVTFITDEEDQQKSAGNPQAWKDALVAAKAGNEQAVVVLGLFGDLDLPNPICQPLDNETNVGAEASPNLRRFVNLWGNQGLDASICAEDYRKFFEEAVGVVDDTCDIFDPPD